jgi:hypothetical protein
LSGYQFGSFTSGRWSRMVNVLTRIDGWIVNDSDEHVERLFVAGYGSSPMSRPSQQGCRRSRYSRSLPAMRR